MDAAGRHKQARIWPLPRVSRVLPWPGEPILSPHHGTTTRASGHPRRTKPHSFRASSRTAGPARGRQAHCLRASLPLPERKRPGRHGAHATVPRSAARELAEGATAPCHTYVCFLHGGPPESTENPVTGLVRSSPSSGSHVFAWFRQTVAMPDASKIN